MNVVTIKDSDSIHVYVNVNFVLRYVHAHNAVFVRIKATATQVV